MKIIIDMQPAQCESRYLDRGCYAKSFVKEFLKQAYQHEVILLFNAKFRDRLPELKYEFKNLRDDQIRIFDVPVGSNQNASLRKAGNAMREDFIANLKPDLVLVTGIFDQANTYLKISIGSHESRWKTALIN